MERYGAPFFCPFFCTMRRDFRCNLQLAIRSYNPVAAACLIYAAYVLVFYFGIMTLQHSK